MVERSLSHAVTYLLQIFFHTGHIYNVKGIHTALQQLTGNFQAGFMYTFKSTFLFKLRCNRNQLILMCTSS
ncbi:hypothetical protein BBB56_20105 [Candidatus Pantoea deserta]|uniref:Uncharacterized protein n=1 Tax=Candidatus Pantoea deserta TaxID=1869313 RepID=A0A3N4NS85_9GAMM|nr:hypothetical protein BBB56_20105 [Pantoea deserta]